MGTACSKKNHKLPINKVQTVSRPSILKNNGTSPKAHQLEDELKEKEMAKLNTTVPANNPIDHPLDQLVTQKSYIEIVKLKERSKTASIKVKTSIFFFIYFL